MKKTIIYIIILTFCSTGVSAEPSQEYEEATLEYLSALVSVATYNDRAGRIARSELTDAGWYMKPYKERFHGADAKFFFVENDVLNPGSETYVLAITGTENLNDVMIDLVFGKTFFGGDSPQAFIEVTKKRHLTSKDPMVHRGFNKYTQAAFFTREDSGETFGEYLVGLLKEKKSRQLYIVGHSLGGAVATIGAARLISLGIDPEQIKVISFGAPAVGNSAFAKTYGEAIDLERIVIRGDPVRSTLQSISGGYTQFGREKQWRRTSHEYKEPHAVVVYADAALRNFYDKRKLALAIETMAQREPEVKQGAPMVYVAQPTIRIHADIAEDIYYLEQSLKNSLRNNLNGFVFGERARGMLREELEKAKAAGCEYLILQDVEATKVQTMRHSYYMSLQENIYTVKDGKLADVLYHANGTRDFTPLLASLHNVSHMDNQRQKVLTGKRKLP